MLRGRHLRAETLFETLFYAQTPFNCVNYVNSLLTSAKLRETQRLAGPGITRTPSRLAGRPLSAA